MPRARLSAAAAAALLATAFAFEARAQTPVDAPDATVAPAAPTAPSLPEPPDPFASRGPSISATVAPAAPEIVPHYPDLGLSKSATPMRRYNANMMTAGILMTTVGIVATITGALITASSKDAIDIYCDGPEICMTRDDTAKRTVGSVIMFGGAGIGAVGFPLWIFGGRFVPVETQPMRAMVPDVRIGAGRASATFRF